MARPVRGLDLKSIIHEFHDPLGDVTPVELESAAEAVAEIERLLSALWPSAAWATRCAALKHAMALLKGGIHFYPGAGLTALAPRIAYAVSDLRTGLVKQATLLISAQAKYLHESVEASFDLLFPALLKQITAANPQIPHFAHLALRQVIRYCQSERVAKAFLSQHTSPIPTYRHIAAEAAHIITETWLPKAITPSVSQDLAATLGVLTGDPFVEIADIAILASKMTIPKRRSKKTPSTLPYTEPVQKNAKPPTRSPSKSGSSLRSARASPSSRCISPIRARVPAPYPATPLSPSGEPIDDREADRPPSISEFMPPDGAEGCYNFKALLDGLVQSGSDLSDIIPEQIIPSVVKTAPHFRARTAWETDLNALFERFCDAMKSRLFPLMRAFSYEPWIIQLIARHCDLQEFCESIDLTTPQTYRGAYDFVTRIIELKLFPISFTQPVIELFEKLIRRFARARPVAILEKALDAASKEVDLANIVKAMIGTIESGGNWTEPLDALVAAYEVDEGIRIELELNPPICKLISTGIDAQQQNVVRFIIAAAPRLRRVSFSESVSALLTRIKKRCNWMPLVRDCLVQTLLDVKVMAIVLQFLARNENLTHFLLDALLAHFTVAPPPKLLPLRKILHDRLGRYLADNDPEIRKLAIFIFAEFKAKISREFTSQMRKLTPGQQRIVTMYSRKPAAVRAPT